MVCDATMTAPGAVGTLWTTAFIYPPCSAHRLPNRVGAPGCHHYATGLRPLRYPGGGADTASGGGGKVPGGTIGWIVAVLVIIVVVYLIVQVVM
jgi:hypothetical protein